MLCVVFLCLDSIKAGEPPVANVRIPLTTAKSPPIANVEKSPPVANVYVPVYINPPTVHTAPQTICVGGKCYILR